LTKCSNYASCEFLKQELIKRVVGDLERFLIKSLF